MKKYLFYIFAFITILFSFNSQEVVAKSETIKDVSITFGGDVFQVRTTNIDTFKIREDNTFYFDGELYEFNEGFTLINGTIPVDGITFKIKDNPLSVDKQERKVYSGVQFETYSFPVNVILKSDANYEFEQEVCYKIKNETRKCNVDADDKSVVIKSSSYSYYYDFMPFYKQDAIFEEITFNVTMTNTNTNEKLIFNNLSFSENEIVYNNYFDIGAYNYSNNSITYNDNLIYVWPTSYNQNGVLFIYAYFAPGREYNSNALYDMSYSVCVGDSYQNCVKVYSNPEGEYISLTEGIAYKIPLSIIEEATTKYIIYDFENNRVNYDSFLLKGEYSCKDNCGTYDNTQVSLTNEYIYYLNIKNPSYIGELNGREASCNTATCYGTKDAITNKVEFSDDNGIEEISYYISTNSYRENSKFVNNVSNGENLTFGDDLSGLVYLHFKVKDGSGSITYFMYRYFFDKDIPYLNTNNFGEYSSEQYYGDITINVSFKDDSSSLEKIYYLIKEYNQEVTLDDFINKDNIYDN